MTSLEELAYMKSFAALVMFWALSVVSLHAQNAPALPARPAPAPNDTLKSVEIQSDHHVTFRLWAPKAAEVKLQCEGPEATPGFTQEQWETKNRGYLMQKQDDGIWQITIGPIEPGIYRYNFLVDGVRTIDPRNADTSQGLVQVHNLYEIPGEFSEYLPDIPHGAVATVYYPSKVTGGMRRMHIYTPPGYETGTARLPVLYLLHGATDSDDAWPTVGRAGAILDHLIAQRKAVPMIIVMPAGHTTKEFRFNPGGPRMGHDAFNEDFVSVIVPYVDAHYRTVTDRDHRAIAGLSMGGAQTLAVSLNHSADFGWVGVFSSGFFPNMMKDAEDADLANYRASGKPFRLFWVGVGNSDFLLQTSRATVTLLNKYGIQTEMHETEGFHSWNVWREYLNMFAPQLFSDSRGH